MTQKLAFYQKRPLLFAAGMTALFIGLALLVGMLLSPLADLADGSLLYYLVRVAKRLLVAAVFGCVAWKTRLTPPLLRVRLDGVLVAACVSLVVINLSVPHLFDARSWLFAVQNPITTFAVGIDCTMTSILEELVFRGVVFGALLKGWEQKRCGKLGAVVVSSVLFGLVHLINLAGNPAAAFEVLGQVGYSALIGILLSAAVLRTGGLVFSVAVHALFNFVFDYAQLLPFSPSAVWVGGAAETVVILVAYLCLAAAGIFTVVRAVRAPHALPQNPVQEVV